VLVGWACRFSNSSFIGGHLRKHGFKANKILKHFHLSHNFIWLYSFPSSTEFNRLIALSVSLLHLEISFYRKLHPKLFSLFASFLNTWYNSYIYHSRLLQPLSKRISSA
jgi:hypothetical protein